MKTGEICKQSGTYYCQEHRSYTMDIQVGDTFPPCNYNGNSHGAVWILK